MARHRSRRRVLTRAISELRRIFDDDSKQPRIIETTRSKSNRSAGTGDGLAGQQLFKRPEATRSGSED